jgi:hypothetical protein
MRVATSMLRVAAIAASGLILIGCSSRGGSSDEQRGGEGSQGGERASVPDDQPHITGIVTEVKRAPGAQSPSSKTILIEQTPRRCSKGNGKEGCNKLYLDVTHETRIFRTSGGDEEALVQARAAELQRGQRVRAWHTGVLKKSYPGQGCARVVVIDATDAASQRSANSRSPR